jgi:hypothetical protein
MQHTENTGENNIGPPLSAGGTPVAIVKSQRRINLKEVDKMTTMANVAGTEQRMAAGHGLVETHGEIVAKNILLFFLAPLVGLAYIILFPFIGTAALLRALLRI